jgi:prophage antirepressor-like protein
VFAHFPGWLFLCLKTMQQSESLVPAQNGHLIGLSFEGQSVRIIERDGESWFVAHDVCAALGIVRTSDAIYTLEEDQKCRLGTDTFPGLRSDAAIVSESGLYELIFRSVKPEAKRFRKWVTSEVLPQIRRTGGYGAPASPIARLELALADIAREHETRIVELEAHMRPGPDWMTVGEYCAARHPGLLVRPGRKSKLGMLAANKSAVLGLPIGQSRHGRTYCRTYAPAALDAAYATVAGAWQRKDAAASPLLIGCAAAGKEASA